MKGLLEQFSRMEIFLLFLRNPSLTRLSTSCHQIPWERRAFTSLKNMKLFHLKISHLDSIKKSYSKSDAQINGCHTILMRKCTACLPLDFANCKHFGTKAKPKNCHAKFHCLMLYGRKSLNHCLPLTRMYTKNVANHSPVAVTEIMKFLTNKGLKFEKGHTCIQTICPKHKLDGGNIAEPKKLFINMTSGFFVCNSCRKSGLWSQLQDMVNVLTTQGKWKGVECFKELPEASQKEMLSHVGEVFKNALSVKSMAKEELAEWRELCDCKELLGPTFIKYGVMFDKPTNSLLMPFHANHQTVCGFRRLTRKGSVEEANKVVEVTLPKLGPLGLFGMNIVDRSTTEIVLTISEWDAMAVYQTTNFSALALPRGILMLPQEVLPLLEPFSKIILWFGNDLQSWEAAKQFAKKLNERRCYLIRPNSDDLRPLEALKQNQNLKRILNAARLVMHQSITTFPQMREEVYSEVAQLEQVSGIKWKRFPMLNKILKGHRRGELTVFTGPTGTGKTTFMSDYSLDLCMRGVNTLWGSFELRNVRLAKILLTQFAQINLSQNLEEFDHWADKFEHLPLYFMTFFGQENIKRVIETMSHAVYVHDIAHVVVDNVQFMMGSEFDGFDRFIQQDQIIAAFRKFATTKNCHVSLVMHPRKEKDGELLTIASVFGGAKATQEADNVIILQDKFLANLRTRKYIQILKNRFDGELGIMPLRFDKDTQSFSLKAVEKLKQNP